jgi:hypothetical protein
LKELHTLQEWCLICAQRENFVHLDIFEKWNQDFFFFFFNLIL